MERLQWTFLQAAVRHAQRPEVQTDPKTAVLAYLRAVASHWRHLGHYSVAYQAMCVVQSITTLGSVNAVHKLLRAEYGNDSASIPSQGIPSSNTGITPTHQNILEEYIDGKS